jgi:hypothetical protein
MNQECSQTCHSRAPQLQIQPENSHLLMKNGHPARQKEKCDANGENACGYYCSRIMLFRQKVM